MEKIQGFIKILISIISGILLGSYISNNCFFEPCLVNV